MWDWEKVSKKSQTAIKLVTHIPKSVEKATCKRAKAQKTFQARTDQKHLYQWQSQWIQGLLEDYETDLDTL